MTGRTIRFTLNPRWAAVLAFLALALAPPAARADGWAPNLTYTATWHDNATNASASTDRIGALQTAADIVASERYSVGRDDSFHLGLHFAGEWWPRYNQLMTGAAGAQAEWRHKFGLGALAPVVSAEVTADAVAAKETGREGTGTALNLALRKRFSDLWRGALTQEFARHDARFAVYDRRGAESAVEISRDLTDVSRLMIRAFWRDGDVLSYATPPRPDLAALAPHRATVDTFRHPLVAYSIKARTIGAKLSLIHALDVSSAVIAGYEWRETEHGPLRYVNQLVSLALVHQF